MRIARGGAAPEPATLEQVADPVNVANIDGDCSSEILISGCEPCAGPGTNSDTVIAYDCAGSETARPIWNQNPYRITNVDDDGTIPRHEVPSWQDHNSWLAQRRADPGAQCELRHSIHDRSNL